MNSKINILTTRDTVKYLDGRKKTFINAMSALTSQKNKTLELNPSSTFSISVNDKNLTNFDYILVIDLPAVVGNILPSDSKYTWFLDMYIKDSKEHKIPSNIVSEYDYSKLDLSRVYNFGLVEIELLLTRYQLIFSQNLELYQELSTIITERSLKMNWIAETFFGAIHYKAKNYINDYCIASPFGINLKEFPIENYIPYTKRKYQILVYLKEFGKYNAPKQLFLDLLKQNDLNDFQIFWYSHYDSNKKYEYQDFVEALKISKFMMAFSPSETNGNAFQEAKVCLKILFFYVI